MKSNIIDNLQKNITELYKYGKVASVAPRINSILANNYKVTIEFFIISKRNIMDSESLRLIINEIEKAFETKYSLSSFIVNKNNLLLTFTRDNA